MEEIYIKIDRSKCIGSQTCIYYAPENFKLDAEGKSVFVRAEGIDADKIQEAADCCPVGAITVVQNLEKGKTMQ